MDDVPGVGGYLSPIAEPGATDVGWRLMLSGPSIIWVHQLHGGDRVPNHGMKYHYELWQNGACFAAAEGEDLEAVRADMLAHLPQLWAYSRADVRGHPDVLIALKTAEKPTDILPNPHPGYVHTMTVNGKEIWEKEPEHGESIPYTYTKDGWVKL